MTEANGDKTTYNYDGECQVIMVMYRDGSATGYTYDRSGNIAQRTDYHNNEVIEESESEHDYGNPLIFTDN